MRDRVVELLARSADYVFAGPGDRPPPEPEAVKRILVVKPCCLGDVLMATPALRALRRRFATAEIDVLTTEWCAPALQTNPRINRIYRYPDRATPLAVAALARRARRRRYDVGVSLDRSPVVNTLLTLAGIPERSGIDSHHRGVGLTRRVAVEPDQHETELYLRVVRTLGAQESSLEPEFRVPESAAAEARALLGSTRRPIIAIHPGGAVNPGSTMLAKRWPAIRYGELASLLARDWGASIVVLGSDSDREAAQTTADFTDAPVLNLCGVLSLHELAAVCQQVDLYIGNDSGTSHLASAVGTPTVTLFGPTNPHHYRPLGPNARVCAPAASWELPAGTDLRAAGPDAASVDIRLIQVADVLDVCQDLLRQLDRSSTRR